MNKQVIVTFDFDTETNLVSNVKCNVDGVEKKKRTTKKKEEVAEVMEAIPIITRETNKLVFNNNAVALMGIKYEDRIIIEWKKEGKTLFPVIGTDISMDKEGAGNKLTKSKTIGYKGSQNTVLADLGTEFTLEPYEDGIWKLVNLQEPTKIKTLEDVMTVGSKINLDLIAEPGDENIEIDEEPFSFNLV